MRPLLFILSLIIVSQASSQNLRSGGRLKPEQAIMDVRHYTVSLKLDPEQQSIDGYCEIQSMLLTRTPDLIFDLWHGFTVSQVWVDGKKELFVQTKDDLIKIKGQLPFEKGKCHVKIAYSGKPIVAERAPWIGGFQWNKDSKGNPWIAITCEGEGAKIYFPCKDHPSDEPNEGADLIITVPAGLTVAGPGLLKKMTHGKEGDTFHWSTSYTINNYSIVFDVGKYKKLTRTYTTVAGHQVPMDFYLLEEHADKGPHLMDLLERFCHFDEKYYGEYPWYKEKIGVAETPHLGMEHQTMIAYGNQFRYSKIGGQDFDGLLHHEFGHEWWGNKVTSRDWAHMWIHEGICAFGDALYVREMEGEEAYEKRMQDIARHVEGTKPIVQGEEVDSDDTYQRDIYGKGAFFMHTIRYVIGDDAFFPTLKKLAMQPRFTYDTLIATDDVERLFVKETKKNLKPLFDFFLRTTQKLDINVKQLSDSTYTIKLNNFDGTLPIDIVTTQGLHREMIDKNGIKVTNKGWPVVDPKVFYLKRVILE